MTGSSSTTTSGGVSLARISDALVAALDADQQDDAARRMFNLGDADTPTEEQIAKAAVPLKKAAIQTLMAAPPLRKLILDLRQKFEQIVDEVSKDVLIPEQTGYSPEARQKAEALVKSFESYLAEHKDEIDALQFFYSVPHKKRLRFKDIQGTRQCHFIAPALMDAGEAVACLRNLGKVQGARCVSAAAPDRHCVARAIRPPSRRRACAARGSRPRAISATGWPSRRTRAGGSRTSRFNGSV